MALLTLLIEDLEDGLISVRLQSDTDTQTAPLTPAMIAASIALDTLMSAHDMVEEPCLERMH